MPGQQPGSSDAPSGFLGTQSGLPRVPPPSVDVSFVIEEQDLLAFNMAWLKRSGELRRLTVTSVVWAMAPVASGVAVVLLGDPLAGGLLVALGIAMAVGAMPYFRYTTRRNTLDRIRSTSTPALLGPRRVAADEHGLRDSGPRDSLQLRWSAISGVETTDPAVYVYYGPVAAVIVPRRAFESEQAVSEFVRVVEHYRQLPMVPATAVPSDNDWPDSWGE